MSPLAKELLEQALTLDEAERATLAGALIESLHGPADPGVEEAWNQEIQRRVEELDAGVVQTTRWSEVKSRLFRGLD